MKFNTINIMPLKNGKEACGWASSTEKELESLVSHPWPWAAHSHCWEKELVTDGMLITTLGTWLGCVGALFSVSWLLVSAKEVLGTEMSVEASCE